MKISNIMRNIILLFALVATSTFGQTEASYSPHKYQQNDWFAEFGENVAAYVNPASLVENDQWEVSFGAFRTLSWKAGQEFISTAFPVDYNHTFGFTVFDNGASIDDTTTAYTEQAFLLSYAYRLIHSFGIGVNLSIINVNAFNQNKQITGGLDFGFSWNPVSNSRLGHLQIGVALQNALQPSISTKDDASDYEFVGGSRWFGADLIDEGSVYHIPANLNFSFFYRGFHRMLEAKMELSLIDVFHEESEGGDAELLKRLENSFTATYYIDHHIGIRGRITKEGYPVIGATVNVKDLNFVKHLQLILEMSHDDIIQPRNRGFISSFRVHSRFGPTREEYIGLDRYRRLKIEPENDYRNAMKLYHARKFLEASYAFGKVVTKYPTFHLADQAAFYQGKSFENMRMHRAATMTYKDAIKKYPLSENVAKYQYQLMNIAYKENDYAEALSIYRLIAKKYAETDIKADADYVAGQIKFNQKEYDEALKLLKPILPGNQNYMYARFTMGIIYSLINKDKEAEAAFEDIINQEPYNDSEREIQDAAKVKLGHLLYNESPKKMIRAVELYQSILPESAMYGEAVLAMSWAFLYIGRTDEGLKGAEFIINRLPNSYLVSEAYLIKGYGHFIKKQWKESRMALEECVKRSRKPIVSKAEFDNKAKELKTNLDKFGDVQSKAYDLSLQLPTPRVQQKRAKLRPTFDKANELIENHYVFLARMEESNKFENNRQRVLEDAEYTLALVISRESGGTNLGDELEDLEE